ncbi:hypothetical protein B296_00051213 [Ensete ventricosum]|uniref:Uncharacterized protein n=1 Tax=Ensete ventricosum TaxID=4639 RepID=A0A426XUH1_ENSVE|nr:hypothetical protein B296_00051213 [Ensete ventricosum]
MTASIRKLTALKAARAQQGITEGRFRRQDHTPNSHLLDPEISKKTFWPGHGHRVGPHVFFVPPCIPYDSRKKMETLNSFWDDASSSSCSASWTGMQSVREDEHCLFLGMHFAFSAIKFSGVLGSLTPS